MTNTSESFIKAICSECREPARFGDVKIPGFRFTTRQGWGHMDGEPLCPVVGDHGYEPAQPIEGQPVREYPCQAEWFTGDIRPEPFAEGEVLPDSWTKVRVLSEHVPNPGSGRVYYRIVFRDEEVVAHAGDLRFDED